MDVGWEWRLESVEVDIAKRKKVRFVLECMDSEKQSLGERRFMFVPYDSR